MKIHEASYPAEIANDWIRIPETGEELKCKSSQVFWILANIEKEDPNGIIKTFVLKSEGAKKGIRLFERNSLRRFLEWKYTQATNGCKEKEAVAQ